MVFHTDRKNRDCHCINSVYLSCYDQQLCDAEERLVALGRTAQGDAEQRVMTGVQVILEHSRVAQQIWQYKLERLTQDRPGISSAELAGYRASLSYFYNAPVLTWVDRYSFLQASIASTPRKGRFRGQPGEWNPDTAILLLWQAAKQETDKLSQ